VFWVALDGSVNTVWWNQYANYGNWNTAFSLSGPGSALASKISVVCRLSTCLDLFWVAPDGSVRSVWWNAAINNGDWNGEFNVAPAGSAATSTWQSSPWELATAIARTPTHIDVFWVGPDGSIRTNWWDQAAYAAWNTPFNVAPPGSAAPGAQIITLCRNNNMVMLFWVTPTGGVSTTVWDGNFNAWRPVTQLASNGNAVQGTLSAIARTSSSTELVWTSPDGSMKVMGWNFDLNNANWNSAYQFAPPGSAALPNTSFAQTQNSWRSCKKCQSLFYGPFNGPCAGGGTHDATGSWNYSTVYNAQPTGYLQDLWRSCKKCQCLYYSGIPGACAAGGQHDPTGSWNYQVLFNCPASGVSQDQWASCSKCRVLYYGPFKGICPAGGTHDATGSFDYDLVYALT
jgi:hypothetical protein